MVAGMEGQYQVPIQLVSDRFGCPSGIQVHFVEEVNAAFALTDDGGSMDDDFAHL